MPWCVGQSVLHALASDDVVLSCVKDGHHRLSRPQDLEMLQNTVMHLIQHCKGVGSGQ